MWCQSNTKFPLLPSPKRPNNILYRCGTCVKIETCGDPLLFIESSNYFKFQGFFFNTKIVSIPKYGLVMCRSLHFTSSLDLGIAEALLQISMSIQLSPDSTCLPSRLVITIHRASLNWQGLSPQVADLSLTAFLGVLFLPASVLCAMLSEDTLPPTKWTI